MTHLTCVKCGNAPWQCSCESDTSFRVSPESRVCDSCAFGSEKMCTPCRDCNKCAQGRVIEMSARILELEKDVKRLELVDLAYASAMIHIDELNEHVKELEDEIGVRDLEDVSSLARNERRKLYEEIYGEKPQTLGGCERVSEDGIAYHYKLAVDENNELKARIVELERELSAYKDEYGQEVVSRQDAESRVRELEHKVKQILGIIAELGMDKP